MSSSLGAPPSILAGAAMLALSGCPTPMPPPPPTDVPRTDGGMLDVGEPMDTPPMDGEMPDAPSDAGAFDWTRCMVAPSDVIDIGTDARARTRIVGLAAGATSWGLAWHEAVDGTLDQIKVASIGSSGVPVIRQLTTGLTPSRDPAIARAGSGWLVAWQGIADANFEILAQTVGADMMPVGTVQRLSMSTDLDTAVTVLPVGAGFLAAWVNVAAMTNNLGVTRALDAAGVPTAAPMSITTATHSVERPVLASRSAGAILAWAQTGRTPREAYLQALDVTGGTSGTPMVVGTEMAAGGSCDVDTGPLGGAIVYDVSLAGRSEVRIRVIDDTGTAVDTERPAVPDTGLDASVAAFGGGFAVAYRTTGAAPEIRVAFLDGLGAYLGELTVAATESAGGRTSIRVTDEGRILVAWGESTTFSRVRAARVRCE